MDGRPPPTMTVGYGGPAPETAPCGGRGSTRGGEIEAGGGSGAQRPWGLVAAGALAAPPIAAPPIAAPLSGPASSGAAGVVGFSPVRTGKAGDAGGVEPEVAADVGDDFGERALAGVLGVVVEPFFEIAQQPLGVAADAAGFERGPDAAPDLPLAAVGGILRGVRGLAGLRGLAPFLPGVAVFGEPGFEGHDLADGAGDAGELQRRVGRGSAGASDGGPAGTSAAARIAWRCRAGRGPCRARRVRRASAGGARCAAAPGRRVPGDGLGDGWGEIHEQKHEQTVGKSQGEKGERRQGDRLNGRNGANCPSPPALAGGEGEWQSRTDHIASGDCPGGHSVMHSARNGRACQLNVEGGRRYPWK